MLISLMRIFARDFRASALKNNENKKALRLAKLFVCYVVLTAAVLLLNVMRLFFIAFILI